MSKKTVNALIARGFDNVLALNLSNSGITLGKLKSMSQEEMINLGINQNLVSIIHSESRPPIPESVLLNVLYKNKRTCCICRDSSKPIVVHHIHEWHISRDHSENNLAVLCLEHHDLAHSKKQLSQNLSTSEILNSKSEWENDTFNIDALNILGLKEARDFARWDWINTQRVFDLLHNLNFKVGKSEATDYLYKMNIIDDNGILKNDSEWNIGKEKKSYFIDFYEGSYIANYLSSILEHVVSHLPIIDITSFIREKTRLKSLIQPGSYIAAQLPFYFKTIPDDKNTTKEIKRAYYRGHAVRVEFTFNSWYCLSSSAKFDAMTGRNVQTVFGFVRDISDFEGELIIKLSCLGSGTAFKRHEARMV